MIHARAGTFPGAGHVQNGHARMGNPRGDIMGVRFCRQVDDAIGLVKVSGGVDRQGCAARGVVASQD